MGTCNVAGTGYQLNLLINEDCDVARITNTIQPLIPNAKVKSEMGSLLCYMLPSDQCDNFPQLFDVLEREKEQLCISSIGVSITTLEEVFLRCIYNLNHFKMKLVCCISNFKFISQVFFTSLGVFGNTKFLPVHIHYFEC